MSEPTNYEQDEIEDAATVYASDERRAIQDESSGGPIRIAKQYPVIFEDDK